MTVDSGNAGTTTQPNLEMHLQPMGFHLKLISNSPAILAAAEASFGPFGTPPDGTVPDFTFYFIEQPGSGSGPALPVFRRAGHLIYQTVEPDSTMAADLGQGFAFGYFSTAVVNNRPYFQWHFLELALFQMLEANGLMGVHAAALVRNGRALLLRAPSSGGKTTLAYAGARDRFQVLAEDVVWVDPDRERWWGLPWSFHLLPDARELFTELASYRPVVQTSGEMKLTVNPEKIRAGSTVFRARPGPVVFVDRVPGKRSHLSVIDTDTALTMWPDAQTGLESQLSHHAPIIRGLLKENTYQLCYGDDIEMALDLLEALI